jgi:LPS sulfotransferase NodH
VPNDWHPPLITYYIATTPRSGSTYFCTLLRKTNFLGYPDEFFNEAITVNAGRLQPTLINQFTHARRDGTTSNGVCGIKIMAEQFADIIGQTILDEWFPIVKWLFLRRRDKLAQAISFDKAEQTGSWSSLEEPKHAPVYSRERIDQKLLKLNEQEAFWKIFFLGKKINSMEIWYEDLLNNIPAALQSIATHIGVQPPHNSDTSRSTYFDKMSIQRDKINLRWADLYRSGE